MPRKDEDQLGHVPKITPAHDEIASYQRTQSKGKLVNSLGEVPEEPSVATGTSMMTRSVLALLTIVLIATAGLAGYLFQKLTIAEGAIDNYELRISDLERRLEVTDESMSESSLAMKVKVRELDSEIRKLWDNVWKRAKQNLAEHDATLEKHAKRLDEVQKVASGTQQQFEQNKQVVAGLSTQLKKAEQMGESVTRNTQQLQAQITSLEAAVDKLNRMSAELNKLDKRVQGTEEWIESINGFRRQMNREITTLKQALGQAAPAAP